MNTGAYISGIAHAALILWLLFGGFLLSSRPPEPAQVSNVTLLSSEEFAALSLPQTAPQVTIDEVVPVAPEATETPPEQPASPQEAPSAETPPQVEQPAGQDDPPESEPLPTPEPITPEVAPQPVPELEEIPEVAADPGEEPTPAPAPRVAPVPAVAPEPETEVAEEASPEVSPDAEAETQAEETPATAPEEAATEIVTEAETPASAAPQVSQRPMARPKPPAPQVAETQDDGPDPVSDAVAAAVAEAANSEPTAPRTGPPLTGSEKEALRVSVQKCWNVGSLSSDALSTTVVVLVSLSRDGKPDTGSIRMLSSSGGSATAARQAFEAARRAIIRCGAKGFDLPADKYSQWQEIEMTFNPEKMRIK